MLVCMCVWREGVDGREGEGGGIFPLFYNHVLILYTF